MSSFVTRRLRMLSNRTAPPCKKSTFFDCTSTLVIPNGACFASSTTDNNDEELRLKFSRLVRGYRKENYGQTLFSRFVKEVVKYSDTNKDDRLSLDEVTKTLRNIGVSEDDMSPTELARLWKGITKESGVGSDDTVPVDVFITFANNYHEKLEEEQKLK